MAVDNKTNCELWERSAVESGSLYPVMSPKDFSYLLSVALTVPVRCDGPCGGMTDANYVEFGLCEHNVCRHCYETAKSADHDGNAPFVAY